MTEELFDDDAEDKALVSEDDIVDEEAAADLIVQETRQRPACDARRRLESLLEEKRLRDELEDFLDY